MLSRHIPSQVTRLPCEPTHYFKPRSRTRTGAKREKKNPFFVAHPHTPPILSASPTAPSSLLDAGRAGVPRRNQQLKCLNRRGLDPHTVVTEP